ncbi:MAG: PKD domain-containing protein [Flavobacteriales bacterium]|nr:PKD domain-containing protein [Flavobacteriales bacterium]MCX7769210.1 PKD domain-containing protein [Flavobacteriales bacterium]
MQCVAATLNNPPVADFVANATTVAAGGTVTFTDLSTFNPTSWSWSFPGGTPASFSGQNPPAITYNNPGVYDVTLTVSNPNGSDTETKPGYITVTAGASCTAINYPPPSTWTLVNYYTGSSPGSNGWVNGVNMYGDKQKAMYFDASSTAHTHLVDCFIGFGRAYSANPNKIVTIRVYDGTAGPSSPPGAQLGSMTLKMSQIMNDVSAGVYTYADFATPIPLPASRRFFVSVDFSNLQWTTTVKDTLSIVSNTDGQTTGYPVWEMQSDNQWYRYGSSASWNLNISLLIHPFLTSQPALALFSQSAAVACTGEAVQFDATGSIAQDDLEWYFPGASPTVVNDVLTPTVFFHTPGTHNIKLYVVGGGCSDLDSAEGTITVFATPSVDINASTTEICPGASVTLTASGATSYTWSPATGLNTTTGPTVIATPSQTTTYTVTGTSNTCSSTSTVQITVRDLPDANVSHTSLNIQCKESVTFDASQSEDVTSFAWTFTGGTPSSSNASVVVVTYNNEGTFPATLNASNICGSDNSFSVNVVVNGPCNVGLTENQSEKWTVSQIDGFLIVQGLQPQPGEKLCLYNALGQRVYERNLGDIGDVLLIPVHHLAAGIYYVVAGPPRNKNVVKAFVR